MELKLGLKQESIFELLFLFAILLAIVIASFGKVLLGGVIGILLIAVISIIWIKKQKGGE